MKYLLSSFQYIKFILPSLIIALSPCTFSAEIQIKVNDEEQKPIEYAVVYVNEKQPQQLTKTVIIDQVDKEFIPYVTAVQRGSKINFPNNDDIRHQVYSFSKTKQFELPLYNGNPLRPVLFNQAGVVSMACNIHDWMKAYVYVVETSNFVITDKNGHAVLPNLKNGNYEVLVWHPTLIVDTKLTAQKTTVSTGNSAPELTFIVAKKNTLKAWRAPKAFKRRGY